MRQAPILRTRRAAVHAILGVQTLIAILPVILVIMNSFKDRKAIFSHPMAPPGPDSFSLIGYETVLKQGDFLNYFFNSSIVTVGSIFFILLFGAMAAFALTEYRFRGNIVLGLFLALGVMVPLPLLSSSTLPFSSDSVVAMSRSPSPSKSAAVNDCMEPMGTMLRMIVG